MDTTTKCPTCGKEESLEMDENQKEIAARFGILSKNLICDECSEKATQEEVFQRKLKKAKIRYDYVIESIGLSGMPPRTTTVKPENQPLLKWRPTPETPGFYLWGEPRRGKTSIALLIAKALIWHTGREAEHIAGTDLKWLVNPSDEDHQTARDVEREWKNCPILIFDDMDKRKGTAASVEYLYNLLNYRLSRGMATIITANASPAQLAQKLDAPGVQRADVEAVRARIMQFCSIANI